MKRIITRRIPGFSWVQFGVTRNWKTGHWWAYRGIARTHALGPFRIVTMRTDCIERGKKTGLFL